MNFEYLVYNKNGTALTSSESAAIYKILATLPFPVNTNPLNADAIKKLSKAQQAKLDTDEPSVIIEKIKEINPNLEIILFPKSLQQFYLFAAAVDIELSSTHKKFGKRINEIRERRILSKPRSHYENMVEGLADWLQHIRKKKNMEPLNKTESVNNYLRLSWAELTHEISAKFSNFTNYSQDFYELCNTANEDADIIAIWQEINTALIEEFASVDQMQSDEETLLLFADTWINNYRDGVQDAKDKNNTTGYQLTFPREMYNDDTKIELLHHILDFEIKCMFDPKIKHLHIIYRGSIAGYDSDQILLQRETEHSLSFGNGILEANVNDPGACAFNYMRTQSGENSGFALLFSKQEHGSVITVPPLTSIAKSLGNGNMVHPRTMPAHNKKGVPELLLRNTIMLTDTRDVGALYIEELFGDRTSLAHYLLHGDQDRLQPSLHTTKDLKNTDIGIERFSAILVFFTLLVMGLQISRWFNTPTPSLKQGSRLQKG